MSKVLATLDFDGVVSPIDHGRDFEEDSSFEVFQIGGFRCAISKKTLEFISELKGIAEGEPESLELLWATSWESLTEYFPRDTAGALPELSYLLVDFDKARAIAEAAIEADASLVLVFEDHRGVHQKLRNIWKKDERFADRTLISFRPKLEEGITFAQILEAQSLIAAELQKGS